MSTWPIALKHVLKFECGYVNHPQDPGGVTNFGVTQKTYDGWLMLQGKPASDVKGITKEDVESIYFAEYWLAAGCDSLPTGFDVCVFDSAVNCGVRKARAWVKAVETTLTPLSTEQKIRTYIQTRRDYYRSRPHFATFGKGWFNRCNALEALCVSLLKESK